MRSIRLGIAAVLLTSASALITSPGCRQEDDVADRAGKALINGTPTISNPEVGRLSTRTGNCTATLIGPQEFLTAAHCIADGPPTGGFTVSNFEYQSGGQVTFDTQTACPGNCDIDCNDSSRPQWCCDGLNGVCAEVHDVRRIFPQGVHVCYADDLAVGKLTESVTWLTPRQVSGSEPVAPTTLTAIGYGCNARTIVPDPSDPSQTQTTVVESGFGVKRYVSYNWTGQDDFFYCHGDSGGPTLLGGLFDGGSIIRVASGFSSSSNADCGADPTLFKPHIDSMVYGMEQPGVIYRGQFAGRGFLTTVTNGTAAGIPGQTSMEAIQIWSEEPGVVLAYRAHVGNVGWMPEVSDGQLAGTVGQSHSLQAVEIRLASPGPYSFVSYRAYAHGLGWQSWVRSDRTCSSNAQCGTGTCAFGVCAAGTTGQSRPIDALEITIH